MKAILFLGVFFLLLGIVKILCSLFYMHKERDKDDG